MKITVAICTWNRSGLLDQTLAEMQNLRVPEEVEWEVLVVNNNCTDDTDRIIDKHSGRLPVRRLFESSAGQSSARNCAVHGATGDLILWTDDDVLVGPDWLWKYHQAACEHPEASFFGGSIEPWFEGEPPWWLKQAFPKVSFAFAAREFLHPPQPITPAYEPFGANYAVRTKVQRLFLYDTGLGHRGTTLSGGEESAMFSRMLAQGHQGWSVPEATVRHWIPRERQTRAYLYKRIMDMGRVQQLQHLGRNCPKLFGRPRWLYRSVVGASVRYHIRRLFCRPEVWVEDLRKAAFYRGLFWGPV